MTACCFAGALPLASLLWWHSQRDHRARLRGASGQVVLTGRSYERVTWDEPVAPKTWDRPGQRDGAAWRFDLFTPETLYFHAASGLFTVAPVRPAHFEGAPPFGLELLDVRREHFRLQLVGYAGRAADLWAIMESPLNGETFVVREGARFAALGLALESLQLRGTDEKTSGGPLPAETAAVAILHDERKGETVTLHSHERKYTDVPLARLRIDSAGKPRMAREGDVLTAADATYRVERIRLDPPEVVVAKHTEGLSLPEIRILTPAVEEKSPAYGTPRPGARGSASVATIQP
ncbi:MAG: hypothetical protein C0502_06660 [Opitutus sp.]|nr:hypothetical protein [Opitutus sp.]